MQVLLSLFLLLPSLMLARSSLAGSYSFTTIDAPNSRLTAAHGVNNEGVIVGYYLDSELERQHGFVLTEGIFTTVDVPDSINTVANGINDSGQIVGSYRDSGGYQHGFLLSDNNFITIDVPGSTHTSAYGINNKGEIVGTYFGFGQPNPPSFNRGFLLSGSTFTTIQIPPGNNQTFAYGINNVGHIVGRYEDQNGRSHGFVLSDETFTTIDIPNAVDTIVAGINNVDQIIGYYVSNVMSFNAYILSGDTLTIIDVPDGTSAAALGINDKGNIVGEYDDLNLKKTVGFLATALATTVWIDVKPGSDSNPINPKNKGIIPVAILTTAAFDASTVDQASLRFGPGQALVQGRSQLEDVNGDSLLDLVLHFRTQDTGIQCGDTSVSIAGESVEGIPFQGSDTIRTAGCKRNTGNKDK